LATVPFAAFTGGIAATITKFVSVDYPAPGTVN
jgi:hypothetical protein